MKKIEIPNSITTIEDNTFDKCTKLEEINVNEDNVSYSSENGILFNKSKTLILCYPGGKNDIDQYEIPDSVKGIYSHCFFECNSLKNIIILNSVERIYSGAFENFYSLESVEIPNSVIDMGWSVFSNCSKLSSIKISNNLKKINNSTFSGCSGLNNIEIPESVTSIEHHAFYGCSSLESIKIPNTVIGIDGGAFLYCNVVIECFTNSEAHRFSDKNKIPYILLDNSASDIGTEYLIKDEEEWDISENGDGSVKAKWILNERKLKIYGNGMIKNFLYSPKVHDAFWYSPSTPWYKVYKYLIKNVVIENGITVIGEYTFCDCSNLENIELSDSITNINKGAFYECKKLKKINLPNNITNIGEDVFLGCSNLKTIEIPNSVTNIGTQAFLRCESLETIEIPNSVTNIGDYAFYNCSSLVNIEIPNSVTSIGVDAFSGCESLETIEIPNSITILTGFTFYGCSNLKTIEIPNSVIRIGYYVFVGCSNLKEIRIPDSVTEIGNEAFRGCSNLKEIRIPDSVTRIGSNLFRGCNNLENVIIDENNDYYTFEKGVLFNKNKTWLEDYLDINKDIKEYKIPNGVTSIKYNAFSGCKNLETIKIPNSVTSIGNSAFSGCKNLETIEIPNSVTSIGDSAFSGCGNLETIEIPNSVTSIGTNVFQDSKTLIICCKNSEIHKYAESNKIKYAIDDEAPIVTVDNDLSRWINEDINITVNAEDDLSGLAEEAYSFDGGETWQKDNTKIYTEYNEKEIIKVKDKLGNITTREIEIKIDKKEPTIISIEKNTQEWTNEDVVVTVNAEDDLSGLVEEAYSFDGGKTWQKENTKKYNENIDNIVIQVKDNAGNVKTVDPISITNIDKIKPTITSINKEPEEWGDEGGTLIVNAEDNLSGLAEEAYSFDDGETWQKDNKKDFDKSVKKAVIKVRDNAGNIMKKTFWMIEIPLTQDIVEITKSPSEPTNQDVTVTATKKENPEYQDFKIEMSIDGENYEETTSKTLSENGIVYVRAVKDDIIAEPLEVEIDNIDKIAPQLNVEYSTTEFINGNVIATIKSNEKVQEVEGWRISEDKLSLSKEYTTNINESIKVKDLVGNEVEVKINITNIDKIAPTITGLENGKMYYKKATPVAQDENPGTIELTKDGVKVEGYKNGQEITEAGNYKLTATDKAGNTVVVNFAIYDFVIGEYKEETIDSEIYINKIKLDTKLSDIVNLLKNVQEYKITRKGTEIYSNNNTSTDTNLATGDKLTFLDKLYIMVVTGDVNGDTKSDIKDIFAINKHRLNKVKLEKENFKAADINQDGKVDIKDIFQINKYRLGKIISF